MIEQPLITPINEREYRLEEDYTFKWVNKDWLEGITIQAGFIYDGASVPRVFWSLVGIHPDGLMRAASLVHDYLYIHKGNPPKLKNGYGVFLETPFNVRHAANLSLSRKQVDDLFLRMLKASGLSWSKRNAAYLGVRAGGWVYWKQPKKV